MEIYTCMFYTCDAEGYKIGDAYLTGEAFSSQEKLEKYLVSIGFEKDKCGTYFKHNPLYSWKPYDPELFYTVEYYHKWVDFYINHWFDNGQYETDYAILNRPLELIED